ncbi:MAG: M12 family metallo-peptidase [Opitutales bacterium]|nr:M12 family metallo-peptidase [Opitutales bacterium]
MKKLSLTLLVSLAILPGLHANDPIRIDVLVLHTPAVTDHYNGPEGITAHILATMDASNAALENSDIDMIWNLVGIEEVDYTESSTDLKEDLDNLTDAENGLEDVPNLRNAYGADLVSLLRRGAAGGAAGLAWRLNGNNPQNDFGYSVVADNTALSNFTFAHEVGHNLSSGHHRGDVSGGSPELETSYGYRFTGTDDNDYRTIMATGFDFTRIPHFSNPLVSFAGTPTGLPEADPEAADNAASFAIVGPPISDFRDEEPAFPEIFFQPRGTTVVSGNQAILSPQVNGLPPLSLEWFEGESGNESQPVAGANDKKLTLDPATETTAYWLKVTNDEGTAETRSVRVVVVPPPDGPYSTLVEQDQTEFGWSSSTLWQEMIFPSGYVDTISVDLFKSDNGNGTDYPVVKAELSLDNSQIVFQGFIHPDDVTQFLTTITLPVESLVLPNETYRLTLSVDSGGTDGSLNWLAGQEDTVDVSSGIGNSNLSGDRAFTFTATGTEATTFHQWAFNETLSADLGEAGDVLQDDGVTNLIRYAVGGNASDNALDLLPALQEVTTIDNEKVLPFRFSERRDMADVALEVEFSTDLQNWSPLDPAQIVHLSGEDTPTKRVYEARLPIEENDRAFLRLNAQNPPAD